ncbi:MAG: ComF family protein [Gemmatimonadota bacterium]
MTVVHGLKYRGWTGLAALMAQAMAGDARRLGDGGALRLVPVPLSSARRRERGFNQARLIADILGREIGWPVAELLRRPRTGRRQVGLGREDRMANVAGRFRVEEMPPPAGRPVLLVDDVVTTGATAAACAAALHAAGVPCAGVVSFARSLGSLDGEEIL